MSPRFIGAGIRARLAAVLPPHEELAAIAALDHFGAGRDEQTHAALGPGPAGDMLLLHVMSITDQALHEYLDRNGC
ncbi:hypothetical protein [Nocardia sp. NPDC059239]|uniref:hypothetical protein n=1 Tax=Nocardia sp. NPDC059239 TaxID=3346785 RepID=UPI003689856F